MNGKKNYTKEQRDIAAQVDIRNYLTDVHPDQIKSEGDDYSRFLGKRSVSLSAKGFFDNSNKECGNSIDFLKTYLGFDLVAAILELHDYAIKHHKNDTSAKTPGVAEADSADNSNVGDDKPLVDAPSQESDETSAQYRLPAISLEPERVGLARHYLESRGIQVDTELLDSVHAAQYADDETPLVLFKSRETDYSTVKIAAEAGSAYNYNDIPLPMSDADGYFIVGSMSPRVIYICESILAALSLREMRRNSNKSTDAAYASIGSEKNWAAIKRLMKTHPEARIISALDNDEPGFRAALKAPYDYIKPEANYMNWHQQLLAKSKKKPNLNR